MARTPESAAVDFAESSLFTGRFSILALAACGVGFSLSGRLPAAIFSLAAAAVAAAARLWARHVLDGVNAALQAERSCVFPGEPCPLRVTLDNPKWLPLVWLTVRFPLEPGGALRPEHRWETVELPEGGVQKPYYEKNVSFLLGHQRMSYTSRLQAEHRGLLSFDRIRLLSGDGLCLCVREKEIPLPRPVTLAVFPRLVPVSTRWFLRNSWELETGARGFQDDRTVIRNVRAYQPGDNARSLNFRLMARGQGAMVNIYEKISPRRAAFLLDGASFAGLPPEDFESALEILGSLAALVLAGVAALVRWLWRSRSRIRLPEEDDDDGLVRQRLGRRGLLSRLGQRLRVRAFLLRYAGTPRAALLELERWGARRRCRRQSQETPREYLERLAGGPLRDALDAPMQARYSILVDDVERSLYSTLPPRLSREQVRELLSTVHRSARTPPARAK